VVLLWAPPDLAERIRTGDVVTDLLRPIDPVWQLLAARACPSQRTDDQPDFERRTVQWMWYTWPP
jgi:hypothetical protein